MTTDVASFRAGDWIKGAYLDPSGTPQPFEGRAYTHPSDTTSQALGVAGAWIRHNNGARVAGYVNLRTDDPIAPVPPQELGAVILNVTTVNGSTSTRMMRVDTTDLPWVTLAQDGTLTDAWCSDEDLFSWTTATVTPGEEVSR